MSTQVGGWASPEVWTVGGMQGDSVMAAEQGGESGGEDFRKMNGDMKDGGASVGTGSAEERSQKPNVAPQDAELATKSGIDKVLNGIEDHEEVAPVGMLSLQEDPEPSSVAPQSDSIAEKGQWISHSCI